MVPPIRYSEPDQAIALADESECSFNRASLPTNALDNALGNALGRRLR
jgi:hypothetical protein